MNKRKAFSLIDVLATIAVMSVLSMTLIHMSTLAYRVYFLNSSMDATYREVSNFVNIFGKGDTHLSAEDGTRNSSYICTASGEGKNLLETSLTIFKDANANEYTLNVSGNVHREHGNPIVPMAKTFTIRRLTNDE